MARSELMIDPTVFRTFQTRFLLLSMKKNVKLARDVERSMGAQH